MADAEHRTNNLVVNAISHYERERYREAAAALSDALGAADVHFRNSQEYRKFAFKTYFRVFKADVCAGIALCHMQLHDYKQAQEIIRIATLYCPDPVYFARSCMVNLHENCIDTVMASLDKLMVPPIINRMRIVEGLPASFLPPPSLVLALKASVAAYCGDTKGALNFLGCAFLNIGLKHGDVIQSVGKLAKNASGGSTFIAASTQPPRAHEDGTDVASPKKCRYVVGGSEIQILLLVLCEVSKLLADKAVHLPIKSDYDVESVLTIALQCPVPGTCVNSVTDPMALSHHAFDLFIENSGDETLPGRGIIYLDNLISLFSLVMPDALAGRPASKVPADMPVSRHADLAHLKKSEKTNYASKHTYSANGQQTDKLGMHASLILPARFSQYLSPTIFTAEVWNKLSINSRLYKRLIFKDCPNDVSISCRIIEDATLRSYIQDNWSIVCISSTHPSRRIVEESSVRKSLQTADTPRAHAEQHHSSRPDDGLSQVTMGTYAASALAKHEAGGNRESYSSLERMLRSMSANVVRAARVEGSALTKDSANTKHLARQGAAGSERRKSLSEYIDRPTSQLAVGRPINPPVRSRKPFTTASTTPRRAEIRSVDDGKLAIPDMSASLTIGQRLEESLQAQNVLSSLLSSMHSPARGNSALRSSSGEFVSNPIRNDLPLSGSASVDSSHAVGEGPEIVSILKRLQNADIDLASSANADEAPRAIAQSKVRVFDPYNRPSMIVGNTKRLSSPETKGLFDPANKKNLRRIADTYLRTKKDMDLTGDMLTRTNASMFIQSMDKLKQQSSDDDLALRNLMTSAVRTPTPGPRASQPSPIASAKVRFTPSERGSSRIAARTPSAFQCSSEHYGASDGFGVDRSIRDPTADMSSPRISTCNMCADPKPTFTSRELRDPAAADFFKKAHSEAVKSGLNRHITLTALYNGQVDAVMRRGARSKQLLLTTMERVAEGSCNINFAENLPTEVPQEQSCCLKKLDTSLQFLVEPGSNYEGQQALSTCSANGRDLSMRNDDKNSILAINIDSRNDDTNVTRLTKPEAYATDDMIERAKLCVPDWQAPSAHSFLDSARITIDEYVMNFPVESGKEPPAKPRGKSEGTKTAALLRTAQHAPDTGAARGVSLGISRVPPDIAMRSIKMDKSMHEFMAAANASSSQSLSETGNSAFGRNSAADIERKLKAANPMVKSSIVYQTDIVTMVEPADGYPTQARRQRALADAILPKNRTSARSMMGEFPKVASTAIYEVDGKALSAEHGSDPRPQQGKVTKRAQASSVQTTTVRECDTIHSQRFQDIGLEESRNPSGSLQTSNTVTRKSAKRVTKPMCVLLREFDSEIRVAQSRHFAKAKATSFLFSVK